MKKISVITPVYFNSESLLLHIEAIKEQRDILLRDLNVELELIYVNDGSGDDSLKILRVIKEKYPAWVMVVSFTRNFGSLRAIKAGFSYASGDCVTCLSADLQDPACLLPKMVKLWLQGSNYVICERQGRNDPLISKFFSKLFYFLTRRMILSSYPKGGFDVFLLGKKYLHYITNSGRNFNIILLSYWLGIKPKKINYTRLERKHGKSRWTFRKKIRLMIDAFLGFSTVPIRAASLLGIITSVGSFFYGFYSFIVTLIKGVSVPGYASTICLMSFLLGLVIFMLGIIGEYLARIYDEVGNKPDYIVEDVF